MTRGTLPARATLLSRDELEDLIELARARARTMTRADLEEQARNFAAGNAGFEDPRVTRAVVDRAAELHKRR